jgi:hypothetical protein
MSTIAPKNVCYSGTISLFSCIAIVVGIHNYGHVSFFSRLFGELGIKMTMILIEFLRRKEKRKVYKKNTIKGSK